MTTKKTDEFECVELDFDNFDEEAALEDAAESIGLKTAFGKGVFGGQFRDGTIVYAPLDIPRKITEGLDVTDMDAVDQFAAILEAMGLGERAEKVLDQGLISALVFAQKFFDAIEKVTRISLGK